MLNLTPASSNFITPVYLAPSKQEGDDLPGAGAFKPSEKSMHQREPMRTSTLPGEMFAGIGNKKLPTLLNKLLKENPEISELRISFDPITLDSEAIKFANVDRSWSSNPRVLIELDRPLGKYFKANERYDIFDVLTGIKQYVTDFLNQNLSTDQINESEVSNAVDNAKDYRIDPFTRAYKLVLSNPEPHALEIHITEA